MCWGLFYSARGGENFVYDNEIIVDKVEPNSKVKTAALYICGGPEYFGGQFYNNKITTNVPAAWIATMYGGASNSYLYNNTIIPLNNAVFKTFVLGHEGSNFAVAENIKFRSNEVVGGKFDISATDQGHSYSVSWTLNIKVIDKKGNSVNAADVLILDKNGKEVIHEKTNSDGILSIELPEYSVNGAQNTMSSPYTIKVGEVEEKVELGKNKEIVLTMK